MTDKIIIGAGLYGLYSALYCAKKGQSIDVIEADKAPFMRATYINQARVHMGYHYPRSLSTAIKSAGYFKRFVEDFSFCIHDSFDQIYATSSHFSWTDAKEFMKFCESANIPCEELNPLRFFNQGVCDGAFLTKEYTYDAHILRDYYLEELKKYPNVRLFFSRKITSITNTGSTYVIEADFEGKTEAFESAFVLNSTYASVNEILKLAGGSKKDFFKLKYELCEIILTKPDDTLKDIGLTVMDGPFFSIMPFGKTGYHSLTSVTFTPHETSFDDTASFPCQSENCLCKNGLLGNCNECISKPNSAWDYMSALAHKYIKDDFKFEYVGSLFSMKPILKASEIDDSRPTVIRYFNDKPVFLSVLSGKINTVYDLDSFLDN